MEMLSPNDFKYQPTNTLQGFKSSAELMKVSEYISYKTIYFMTSLRATM